MRSIICYELILVSAFNIKLFTVNGLQIKGVKKVGWEVKGIMILLDSFLLPSFNKFFGIHKRFAGKILRI